MFLSLLPEDGGRRPKHVGGKIVYFLYTLYVQIIIFNNKNKTGNVRIA
jgi:hypothetical protein